MEAQINKSASGQLLPPDEEFAASLLTRVGFFISHCDDTDMGEESEEREKNNMDRALQRVAKGSKFPQIAAIANKARAHSTYNDAETEESLSADIKAAIAMLNGLEDDAVTLEYKKAVMFVGKSVARAYREELDHHEEEFFLETLVSKIAGALNRDSDPEEFKDMNISPAEDSALTMIAEALRA